MRWKTTISFFFLLFFFLLLLFYSDETSENSERNGQTGSKDEKKAATKLYHGMNKRYRPGDEPDMQINVTVATK